MSIDKGMPPPLLCALVTSWPTSDRLAWQRALAVTTSPFARNAPTPSGRGGRQPRAATIKIRRKAMGTFVAYLMRCMEETGPSIVPHVTPANIDAFVVDQESRGNRPNTIGKRIENLQAVLRLIAPGRDFGFLLRPGGVPLSRLFSRKPRPVETRDSREIIDAIKAMHADALAGKYRYGGGHTALRDAALLAILACRAPRISEVVPMDLGQHLVRREGRWEMRVEQHDNKNNRHRRVPLPDWVQPIVSDYVDIARPALGGHATPALWLSSRRQRRPLSSLSNIVTRWTRKCFSTGRGPHWLRKCLTTTVANERPELLGATAVMLDHSPSVALEHYNLAQSLVAGRRHNERIELLMATTAQQGQEYLDHHRPRRRPATWKDRYAEPEDTTPAGPSLPPSRSPRP